MFSLDSLFCDVDDFCLAFEPEWRKKLLHYGQTKRYRAKSLCLSEIMTILIAFDRNHYRNFKHFYLDCVQKHWHLAFPKLPSYQRFVEWIKLLSRQRSIIETINDQLNNISQGI